MRKLKKSVRSLPSGRWYSSLQTMILSSFSPQHTQSSLKWFRLKVTPPLGMQCIKWGKNQSNYCTQTKSIAINSNVHFSYPFNVHTLHGYFGYLIMVIIALHTYAVLITTEAAFFLGSSFYLDAFVDDFDQHISQLNRSEQRDNHSINAVQMRIFNAVKFNIQIIKFVVIFDTLFCLNIPHELLFFSVFSIDWATSSRVLYSFSCCAARYSVQRRFINWIW